MIKSRPIFVCGDCQEELSIDALDKNICENCKAELCICICHIGNYSDCDECEEQHEGK
jgi:hypothetical protein